MANPLRTVDLHWAAGFLEGEGSFGRGSRHGVYIVAPQVQREPLERLQRLFGGTLRLDAKRRAGRQPIFRWRLFGVRAVGLAFTLYGLMSPRRRAQIATAISHWKQGGVAARYRKFCAKGHALSKFARQRKCRICVNESNKTYYRRQRLRVVG